MITNKDIRVENGNLVLNGDKFPLDGQSPEAIMEIVEDNSDTTPTENSTAPITSGGVYTALGAKQDTLTFDTTPTDASTNPVTSGGIFTSLAGIRGQIGDLHFAVFEQTFNDVDIDTQWGSLYESATALQIDISSLGLQTPPKMALIGVQTAWTEFFTTPAIATGTAVSFRPLRPASTTGVRIVATALVIY